MHQRDRSACAQPKIHLRNGTWFLRLPWFPSDPIQFPDGQTKRTEPKLNSVPNRTVSLKWVPFSPAPLNHVEVEGLKKKKTVCISGAQEKLMSSTRKKKKKGAHSPLYKH